MIDDRPDFSRPDDALPRPERRRTLGHVTAPRREPSTPFPERRRSRRLRSIRRPAAPAVPRGVALRVFISTRWLSALIVVTLLMILYLFFTREAFFVSTIYVGGTRYLSGGEIFARSGLAPRPEGGEIRKIHILWVAPAEVRPRLGADPAISDVTVELGWPPQLVQITVTEREPALIWEQAGVRVWVDFRGRVMSLREDLPDLARVVVERPSDTVHLGGCPLQGTKEILGPGSCIDQDTVAGVLQFKALYPTVQELVYDPNKGLGYYDGRGWKLWFGDGTDILTKMAIYAEIVRQVHELGGKQFVEVDVSDPDFAYYSTTR